MNGSRIPRYALLILTLGIALASILLALLFRQYSWLSAELSAAAPSEHEAFLRTSYVWLAGGGMVALLGVLGIVSFIVRRQTARIRDLRTQAEKLRATKASRLFNLGNIVHIH